MILRVHFSPVKTKSYLFPIVRGHDAPRAGTGGFGRSEGGVDGQGDRTADHLALERDLLGDFADVLVQLEELIAGRAVDIGPPVSQERKGQRVDVRVATNNLTKNYHWQAKFSWLKRVPLGHKNEFLMMMLSGWVEQTWNTWQRVSTSA